MILHWTCLDFVCVNGSKWRKMEAFLEPVPCSTLFSGVLGTSSCKSKCCHQQACHGTVKQPKWLITDMACVAKQQFELKMQYCPHSIPKHNKTKQRIAYFCFLPRCFSCSYNKRHTKPSCDGGVCQPFFIAARQEGLKAMGRFQPSRSTQVFSVRSWFSSWYNVGDVGGGGGKKTEKQGTIGNKLRESNHMRVSWPYSWFNIVIKRPPGASIMKTLLIQTVQRHFDFINSTTQATFTDTHLREPKPYAGPSLRRTKTLRVYSLQMVWLWC